MPLPGHRSRRLDTRRSSTRTPRSPASRSCSTRTSRPKGTTSSRSAPPPSASTATSWPTRWTSRATSDTRCGSRTCAPAQLYDDQIVGIGAGATWAADNHTVYYVTVDDAWRPDTGVAAPARRRAARREGLPRARREVLARGRPHPQQTSTSIIAAGSAVTTEMRYGDATDGRDRVHRRSGRAVSSSSTPSNTRSSAVRTGSSSCTTTARRTSRSSRLRSSDPNAIPHADRAPRRCATRLCRRVRRPSVVSYRSEALPRIQLWPIYADGDYGHPEDITFDSELMSAGHFRQSQLELTEAADRRDVVRHSGAHLRHRPRHRRAHAAARTAGARRLPPRRVRRAPRLGRRA